MPLAGNVESCHFMQLLQQVRYPLPAMNFRGETEVTTLPQVSSFFLIVFHIDGN